MRALPRQLTDLLRIWEVRLLSNRRRVAIPIQPLDASETAAIVELAQNSPEARLLVVDDAVDSGVTLATVLQKLRQICPAHTQIRSAAITVTLDNPLVEPDFTLYRRVICRFPWSFDAAR
jgi:hypoxanthine phosphoribosyltransferase